MTLSGETSRYIKSTSRGLFTDTKIHQDELSSWYSAKCIKIHQVNIHQDVKNVIIRNTSRLSIPMQRHIDVLLMYGAQGWSPGAADVWCMAIHPYITAAPTLWNRLQTAKEAINASESERKGPRACATYEAGQKERTWRGRRLQRIGHPTSS